MRLIRAGWLVEKTHGTVYSPGWPDLYCHHPDHGSRWVEVKRPSGKLTRAQQARFGRWCAAGVGIWVLTSPDEVDLLHSAPNAAVWLRPKAG